MEKRFDPAAGWSLALFITVIAALANTATGAIKVMTAFFSEMPEGKVAFAPGAVVRDGPFYEVRNISEDSTTQTVLGHRYDFAPVRFQEHRGKWIIMLLTPLASGDEHNDRGGVENRKYALELRRQTRALPNHEFWLVRMNRVPYGMRMTGSFHTCSLADSGPKDGPNQCFDRFVYGAYHRGGADGLHYKPQMKWLSDMRLLSKDPLWMNTGVPLVLAIAPDGRMHFPAPDRATGEYSTGAKATAKALLSLAASEIAHAAR